MRHAPEDYAKALLSLLDEHPSKERQIMEGFVRALAASGDLARTDEVLRAVETALAKRDGRVRLAVRSARPLGAEALERIQKGFGEGAFAENRVAPELLGGIQIIVNGETMIDATLKRKLDALLGPQG